MLQEVREEVQRDHERKLEQLREDHRREMNLIREKYLDEVSVYVWDGTSASTCFNLRHHSVIRRTCWFKVQNLGACF